MKLALVHDDLIQYGGAERLFETMTEIWPEADVFTSMIEGSKFKVQSSKFWKKFLLRKNDVRQLSKQSDRQLHISFMQNLPFKKQLYRFYFPFYPIAFESFDFSDYDIVISSSTRFAHYIITRPSTVHICYMNTPPRMFWEPEEYFQNENFWGLKKFITPLLYPVLSFFRMFDYVAGQRPDYIIANSKTPADRIKKYYSRKVDAIIYPFVNLNSRICSNGNRICSNVEGLSSNEKVYLYSNKLDSNKFEKNSIIFENFFLIVSRLVAWKKIDIAIKACNELKLPLVIIGDGPDRQRLEKLAGSTIKFLGFVNDEEKYQYLQNCQALIFPQKEDFGIVALEAMACGKPVIAYGAGGALETIVDGKTGMFFQEQTVESLTQALKNFDAKKYAREDCISRAKKFRKERFIADLKRFVEEKYKVHESIKA